MLTMSFRINRLRTLLLGVVLTVGVSGEDQYWLRAKVSNPDENSPRYNPLNAIQTHLEDIQPRTVAQANKAMTSCAIV